MDGDGRKGLRVEERGGEAWSTERGGDKKEEDDGMVLVLCVGFCAKISLHLVVITVNLQRRLCL